MPKKGGRSKSKRLTLKQKYKIKKKVSEHHKKKRREERKTGKKPKGPKDPGLPQQWPFKEELVKEFAWKRQQILESEKAKKQERKRAREDKADVMETEESQLAQLAALRSDAARKGKDFEDHKRPRTDAGPGADADSSRRAFYREFRKVVELADVVLCVLDARDPLGSRCPDVERYIRSMGTSKRVVLLMNKMDLVPREVGEQWLKYLREELPCMAFKSSTQQQDKGLQSRSMPMARGKAAKAAAGPGSSAEDALKGAGCLGADTLIQLLKNYARNAGLKTAITVGVVGLPNVGKSSVINSLKRARVAQVGNTPGVTRAVQEIHLDKHIKLLDSPGIVFSSAEGEAAAALRNAVKVERLPDPVLPVGEILRRVPAKQLMTVYKVPTFANVDEFLQRIADARGKLKRGGIPDTAAAARIVLQDWNDGRIPYYTTPPERAGKEHQSAEIVAQWAAEFDADTVFANEASAVIAQLPSMDGDEGGRFFEAASAGAVDMGLDSMEAEAEGDAQQDEAGSSDAEAMDEGDAYGAAPRANGTKAGTSGQAAQLYSEEGQFNPHAARAQKKRQKKARLSLPEDDEDSDFDFEAANEGLPAPQQAMSDDGEGGSDDEGSDDEEEEYGEGNGGDVDAQYLEAMEGSDLEDAEEEGDE